MIASGRWEPDDDGCYFIDRNPKHFNLILDYMRTKKLEVSSLNQKETEKIKSDFDYYQLPFPLLLNFRGNSIISQEHLIQMANWFGDNTTWTLIYRSSRDGAHYSNFIDKVNNKGKCVVVIKSTAGYIFGGYNSFGWSSSNQQRYSTECFLFTIENPYDIPPTKLKMRTTCKTCSSLLKYCNTCTSNNCLSQFNYCSSCGSYNPSCDHSRQCQNKCIGTTIYSFNDHSATSGYGFRSNTHVLNFGGSDLIIQNDMSGSSSFKSYENNTGKEHLFSLFDTFKISEIEVFSITNNTPPMTKSILSSIGGFDFSLYLQNRK